MSSGSARRGLLAGPRLGEVLAVARAVDVDADGVHRESVEDGRGERRRSTCITTNRPFKDWPKVFPDPLNAQIIAERLTEIAEVFLLEKSYRHRPQR